MGLPYQERPVFTLLLAQGGSSPLWFPGGCKTPRCWPADRVPLVGSVAVIHAGEPADCWWRWTAWYWHRYAHCGRTPLQEIDEPQDAPVLIAGFGRYGQIVSRCCWPMASPALCWTTMPR